MKKFRSFFCCGFVHSICLLTSFLIANLHAGAEDSAACIPASLQSTTIKNGDSLTLELPELEVKMAPQKKAALEVKTEFLNKIPNTMNDPIRALSFLPGVTVQSDLNVRPYVRGGSAEETHVIKNGIALLQPYHVGGVFSVFNANTLASINLYKENFPVEAPGALSGIVALTPTQTDFSQLHLQTNLSLLRGDIYSQIPLVQNRLSIYAAAQSFLLNHSLHGLLNFSSTFSQDSLYQQDIQGYRDHINLPGFQDYNWGSSLRVNDQMQIHYSGSLSTDDYTVTIPSQINLITKHADAGSPAAIVPVLPKKEISRSKKLSIDSISSVDIKNQSHFLNIPWDINSENFLENDFGLQFQNWNVDFKKNLSSTDPLVLSQATREFNYRLVNTFSPIENHQFKIGLSYDYKWENYHASIPYPLYDIIVNSNLDMLEGLGYYTDQGFQINKEDSSKSNFDYLGGYPSRIRFTHTGTLEEHFSSLFFSHKFELNSGTLEYGIRGEYQNNSREFFPAPRLNYTWRVDKNNDLHFSSGVYSQNTLPYFERDQNPNLKSEKSAQSGIAWTHRMGKGYRFEFNNYYKRFFDLVTPTLVPNGNVDLTGILLPNPAKRLSTQEIASLKATLDTTKNFGALSDSIKQLTYSVYGDLVFNYSNSGNGNSYGSEFSFFYNPYSKWRGWASLDASVSNRQDAVGKAWYDYRYHRPLIFNWVNYFQIPGNFDIAFTYRFALGQPYTPYTGTLDGSGSFAPIIVGARNSGRLAPYNRLDLRLTKNSQLWKRELKSYIEVWNSMNDPNYFARDNETGELKSAQLNWPFPLLFLGISYQL